MEKQRFSRGFYGKFISARFFRIETSAFPPFSPTLTSRASGGIFFRRPGKKEWIIESPVACNELFREKPDHVCFPNDGRLRKSPVQGRGPAAKHLYRFKLPFPHEFSGAGGGFLPSSSAVRHLHSTGIAIFLFFSYN